MHDFFSSIFDTWNACVCCYFEWSLAWSFYMNNVKQHILIDDDDVLVPVSINIYLEILSKRNAEIYFIGVSVQCDWSCNTGV
jgi:hypothetical protein